MLFLSLPQSFVCSVEIQHIWTQSADWWWNSCVTNILLFNCIYGFCISFFFFFDSPPFTVHVSVPQQLAECFCIGSNDFLCLLFMSASFSSAHPWFTGGKKDHVYTLICTDIERVLPVLTVRGPSPVRETFNYSLSFYITSPG